MNAFETRYFSWLDGQMTDVERAAFEGELVSQHALDPAAERREQDAIATALRQHAMGISLPHADFFNHQLMERIRVDQASGEAARPAAPALSWFRTLGARLALGGAFAALVGLAGFKAWIRPGLEERPETAYLAEVLDAKTSGADVTATPIYYQAEQATVLWLDGVEHLPDALAVSDEHAEGETGF